MIRAAGTQCRQSRHLLAANKFKYGFAIVEMADFVLTLADQSTNFWHQQLGDLLSLWRRKSGMPLTTKRFAGTVPFAQPHDGFIDDLKCYCITFLSGISPGKQAVTTQHDTARIRVVFAKVSEPKAQFITGAFPRKPTNIIAKNVFGQFFTVLCSGDSDNGIRMYMVNM